MSYSTDQVKGVLTLQGDALSQAVSPLGPIPPTVLLVTRMVMAYALPPASCVTLGLTLVFSDLFPCMSVM